MTKVRKSEFLIARITKEHKDWLKEQAKLKATSFSEIVRDIIQRAMNG